MSDLIQKFERYKKKVEKAQNEVSRLKGRLDSLQSSAEEQFGTSKISELKKMLNSKMKQKEKIENELEEKMKELEQYFEESE